MSKKVISFCLFGKQDKYCVGAIRNAELVPQIYPDWIMRVYIAQSVPREIRQELAGFSHVELVHCEEDNWTSMLTRFLPASENDVDVFISRDCDSRLNEREAAAVQQWMENPHLIHVMRDHPHHTTPILGGMWGAKQHAIPDMKELIEKWNKEDRWQTDQDFLRSVIWPKYHHKAMVHDDWNRFPMPGTERRSFPTPRQNQDFVGAIIGPNGERLHPEHHAMVT